MRHYELVVVLSPILNQEQSSDTWGRIKSFISNREAEIVHEETWGTRRLAYPIRKGQFQFLEGNYHLTRFSTEIPFNRELETFLRLDEQVLRSLVTVTGPPKPVPDIPPAEEAAAVADAATPAEEGPTDTEETVAEAEPVVEETVAEAEPVVEETVAEAEPVVEETVAEAEASPVAEQPAGEEEDTEPEPVSEETEAPEKSEG